MEDFYTLTEAVDDYLNGRYGDVLNVDGTTAIAPRIQFFLNHIVHRMPQNSTLVDIGCATANMSSILASARKDLNYIGLDSSFPMLRGARDRYGPATNLVNADVQRLPFRDNSIQYMLCVGTLLYCADPAATIEVLYRIASRVLMFDILYLPEEEEGTTIYQEHGQFRNKVRLLGYQELKRLVELIANICPFQNIGDQCRSFAYSINNEPTGLSEMGDRKVCGFGVVFEKSPLV